MRYMLAVLMALAGCDGSSYDGCADPCPGAVSAGLEWLCDAGPCPVGQSLAEPYFQCRCANGQTLTFRQPDAASCPAARADWNAFHSAHCG